MRIWKKCVVPLAVGVLLTSAAGLAQADTTGKVTWEVPASTSFIGSSVTDDALAGPDRGFRYEIAFNAIDLSSPWDSKLAHNPAAHIDDAIAKWGTGSHVTQLYFYLYDYAKTDIPDQTIANMQKVFDELRSRGMQVVLRFAFDDAVRPQLPYTVTDVQRTIKRVAPLVEKNKDVVSVWQVGFIGAWGEWGPNYYNHQLWPDAVNAIMNTFIANLPTGISTQMRYPWLRNMITDPATKARIGFNNDYVTLGKGPYDYYVPTHQDYASVLDAAPDVTVDGEMPWDKGQSTDPAAWNEVIPGDMAAQRLQSMHYATFSRSHNATVTLPAWHSTTLSQARSDELRLPQDPAYFSARKPTQFEYLRDHLGYRFSVKNLDLSEKDGALSVKADIANLGFSAPVKDYPVTVSLLDSDGQVVAQNEVEADLRSWRGAGAAERATAAPEAPTYPIATDLPLTDLGAGTYTVALTLGSTRNPGQAIQLANDAVAFKAGHNELVTIKATEDQPTPTPEPTQSVTPTVRPTATGSATPPRPGPGLPSTGL